MQLAAATEERSRVRADRLLTAVAGPREERVRGRWRRGAERRVGDDAADVVRARARVQVRERAGVRARTEQHGGDEQRPLRLVRVDLLPEELRQVARTLRVADEDDAAT